jgi:hemerythrin-like metal-binding protein
MPIRLLGLSNASWPARAKARGACPAWRDSLATGHADIDEDHRRLIELLAESWYALAENSLPKAEVHRRIDALHAFAKQHFEFEERLLAHPGMDAGHRDRHIKAHQRFLETVQGVLDMIDNLPSDVCSHFMDFLSSWLVHHIRETDQELARQCHQLGLSPNEPAR